MARRSLIPWLFPAALLPVLAANGALIVLALQSRPALVDAHPFEDGRSYNRELVAAAAQQALGWNATLTAPRQARVAAPVEFAVHDRDGRPVGDLAVSLRVWRPVGADPDQLLRLDEAASGRYRGKLALPQAGQWQFDLVARRGDAEFVVGRRVVVP